MSEQLRERVRRRYADAAATVTAGGAGCCGDQTATVLEPDERFGSALYGVTDKDTLPIKAVAASLGCGNPTAVADLHAGERVLDLGSGGGIDVILSANRVGPTGFVYGVDMTAEMLELARANAAEAKVRNVEFLQGTIENVPLPDAAVEPVGQQGCCGTGEAASCCEPDAKADCCHTDQRADDSVLPASCGCR